MIFKRGRSNISYKKNWCKVQKRNWMWAIMVDLVAGIHSGNGDNNAVTKKKKE